MDRLVDMLGVGSHLLQLEGVSAGLPLLTDTAWRDRRGRGIPAQPRGRRRREAAEIDGYAVGRFRHPATGRQLSYVWQTQIDYLSWKRATLRFDETTMSDMRQVKLEPPVGALVICRRRAVQDRGNVQGAAAADVRAQRVHRLLANRVRGEDPSNYPPSWGIAPQFSDDVLRAVCLSEATRRLYWPPPGKVLHEWFSTSNPSLARSHLFVALDAAVVDEWQLAAQVITEGDRALLAAAG